MKTKTTILFLLLLICCSTAFGQEAQQAVAESSERLVFGGVWTSSEAKEIISNLFATFCICGLLSLPLIATWNSENIALIARILLFVPAVVAIISLIGIIVMGFGYIFSTSTAA